MKGILFSIIFICNFYACQTNKNNFIGEWYSLEKKGNSFFHCIESMRKIEIGNKEIEDISVYEKSVFKIDHIKNKDNIISFFDNKNEKNYYSFELVDNKNKIYKIKLNQNPETFFINKKYIKNIKKLNCEIKEQSCNLNQLSNVFNFNLEASEYENEKRKEFPTSVWITVKKKKDKKWKKEVRFEPLSWSSFKTIPCDYFIVKDFNFDGLEDFAIVTNFGKEALYSYFLQNEKGDFLENEEFPLQGKAFPVSIDVKSKTIILKSSVGCCKLNTITYSMRNGKWEEKSIQEDIKQ